MTAALLLCPAVIRSADATTTPAETVAQLFERVENHLAQFDYDGAISALDSAMTWELPDSTHISIGFKMAAVLCEALQNERAVECLTRLLQENPEAQLPETAETSVREAFAAARTEVERFRRTSNHAPQLKRVPSVVRWTPTGTSSIDVTAPDPEDDSVTITAEGTLEHTIEPTGPHSARVTVSPPYDALTRDTDRLTIIATDGSLSDTAIISVTWHTPGPRGMPVVAKSALIPGWGQLTEGRTGAGYSLLLPWIGGLVASSALTIHYNSLAEKYDKQPEKQANVSSAKHDRNTVYALTAGIHVLSALEAIMHQEDVWRTEEASAYKSYRPQIGLMPYGIALTWRW